jgi:hypothetical protein
MIKGNLDIVNGSRVVGWCIDTDHTSSLQIEIYKNGEPFSESIAQQYRPILHKRKLHPTGKCGFIVNFTENDFKDGDFITVKEKRSGFIIGKAPVPVFKNRVFFMHIAKASGTSLNDFISRHYNSGRVLTHMEGMKGWAANKRLLFDYDFISGHKRILIVMRHHNLKSWYKVTLLRKPIEHIISHLAWVKYIGKDPRSSFFLGHSEEVQDLAKRANNYDFSDAVQLSKFMETLTEHDKDFFDNCQTRYFLPGHVRGDLTKADCNAAVRNLSLFDLIGVTEYYDEFLKKLCDFKKWKVPDKTKRLNVNDDKYGLSLSSLEQQKVLKKYIRYDATLYQTVLERLGSNVGGCIRCF